MSTTRDANLIEMMRYFGCEGRPVKTAEMQAFWKSLTDAEKDFYKKGVAAILDA